MAGALGGAAAPTAFPASHSFSMGSCLAEQSQTIRERGGWYCFFMHKWYINIYNVAWGAGYSVESWEQIGKESRAVRRWLFLFNSSLLLFPSSTSRSKCFRFSCTELSEMVPLRSFSPGVWWVNSSIELLSVVSLLRDLRAESRQHEN